MQNEKTEITEKHLRFSKIFGMTSCQEREDYSLLLDVQSDELSQNVIEIKNSTKELESLSKDVNRRMLNCKQDLESIKDILARVEIELNHKFDRMVI